MQKSPDFMPSFKANLPRTSHVLSHDLSLTATTGHLNPVFHTVMNPGETIKLGFNFNLRTMPLEAAAFGDFVCHTEYFFVPMQLLYQPFDTVVYGISDQFSTQFDNSFLLTNLPVIDFSNMLQDLHTYRSTAALYYPESMFSVESKGQSAIRLLDLLGYCPIGVATADNGGGYFYNPNVFPYPILAYNCIYQYYYRLDAREAFDQKSFNFDRFYNAVSAIQSTDYSPLLYMQMKYRPKDNDYFTDVKVSPIVDVLNLVDKNSFASAQDWLSQNTNILGEAGSQNTGILTTFKQLLGVSSGSTGLSIYDSPDNAPSTVEDGSYLLTQNVHDVSSLSNGTVSRSSSSSFDDVYRAQIRTPHIHSIGSLSSDLNTANIRALFATEKLWSITGRAKKNYDDQTLAHFGFKVPHDVKHQISKFGHDVSRVHVGEVISTANTSLSPLGEIAGKGYGVQQVKSHSFTAPCHGVVMAIFSIVCEHNYEAGILKVNCVADKNDFYQPEFDHLGMQPLFAYETEFFENSSTDVANVLGWQYRYEQYKRRFNRTSGAFKNVIGSLRGWVPTFEPFNGFQNSMAAGKTINQPNTPSYPQFINLPTDANQLFLAQYPSSWSSAYEGNLDWAKIYDNDPFVINSHIDAVLVSTMSDYSLPRLDS